MTIPQDRSYTKLKMTAILVFAAVIYFAFAGGYVFLDPDEGRYAEIPREMIETGDFIIPHLNYVEYLEKPPLFYWLVASSMRVFGQNERAVRLVPALIGFVTVLLVMGLGKRLFGAPAGLRAGWIYLTSALPLAMARMPLIDGLFSLCLSATWGAWWLGYQASSPRSKRGWYLLAWACLGLATMAKGIAAIALTGAIIFLFVLLKHNWAVLKSMAWWPGLPIFLLIAVPWHVAAYVRTPEFAHFYFVVQHFDRLVGTEHLKPMWFFAAVFPLTMLPWVAFLFPAGLNALRRSIHAVRLPWTGTLQHPVPSPATEAILFLTIWIIVVVGLFSVSHSKLIPYILPACPAAALLIAVHLDKEGLKKPSTRWCGALTAVILFALVPVVPYMAQNEPNLPPAQLESLIRALQGAFLLGGLLLVFSLFRVRLMPAAMGLVLLLTLPALAGGVVAVSKHRKIGALVKAMPNPLPPEVTVAEWRTYDRSLTFYTRRRVILVDEVSELAFGLSLDKGSSFFRKGRGSIRKLAEGGPLLLNVNPSDWPELAPWGILRVAAANNKNILLGNEAFFRLTGLKPWPADAVKPPPLLLMPRHANQ
jgi:4-amino-4-deoxy-L-arabinose transferase-like glycosyltransferase